MQGVHLYFREGGPPLYRQLYDHLAGEILSSRLAAGERLPGKRRLAQELHVSVNTVDAAYQMLAAEGYLCARPRSGFTVCPLERLDRTARPVPAVEEPAVPAWRFDLGTGGVDTALFPFKTWRRIQREVLAGSPDLLNRGHPQGDEDLRAAIARYLYEYRGVTCHAGQIVVGAGIEYLLSLLARLFVGRCFAVEDPGYPRTHRVLENNGAAVAFVPVDAQGLLPAALEESGADLACVTPSHQFPTGVTMPVGRRTALLRWAGAREGRWLIEDDYDSEFRFDGRPLPALQGLDGGERVLYIGTFSRSIAPAIRIAYMVLPLPLLARFRTEFGFYSCTVGRFEQQTLRRFLEEGHYARHLARARNAYKARRDRLIGALGESLGEGRLDVSGAHTGLHFLLRVGRTELSQPQLTARAAAQGVHLSGLAAYQHDPHPDPPVLVLGYGGLREEDIVPAAQALAAAWRMERIGGSYGCAGTVPDCPSSLRPDPEIRRAAAERLGGGAHGHDSL